jgi:hypothetical protein
LLQKAKENTETPLVVEDFEGEDSICMVDIDNKSNHSAPESARGTDTIMWPSQKLDKNQDLDICWPS